jgi:hypothetical protein
MPHVLITFDVTEPTMIGGVWTLSKFRWMAQTTYERVEVEDSDGGLINQAYLNTRSAFDKWCEAMPKVQSWHQRLLFTEERLVNREAYRVSAVAYGWFELSDDPVKTQNMLSKVNVETIWSVPDLYLIVGDPPVRSGLLDNDVNLSEDSVLRAMNELSRQRLDAHTYPFSTDNMRYRVVERHDHGWNRFDPRAVRGTTPADDLISQQRDANRAMRDLIEAARCDDPPPVPPAVINLNEGPLIHWVAGHDPNSYDQPLPPPRHDRHD